MNIQFNVTGCKYLAAALSVNNNLEELSLGYNPWGDSGMKALKDALTPNTKINEIGSHTALKKLELSFYFLLFHFQKQIFLIFEIRFC